MMTFVPKFEYLGNCKPGELVRLKVGDESRWGIMCSRAGHHVAPVLILSATEVKTVNIMEEGRITGDFDRIPVLVYGKDYMIEPDHSGPITLVAGEMAKIPGRILQAKRYESEAKDEFYLVATAEGRGTDYVSLMGDAKACTEPGGCKALYSRWRLTHKQITRDGVPQTLLEFDATKVVPTRKVA
jgi:hypothetical protein